MKRALLILLATLIPSAGFAADMVKREYEALAELGELKKPTTRIDNAQEAFDFIMADKIVREGVEAKMSQGYEDWKTTSELMGYDGNEPVYEVRVSSSSRLPPYVCRFRFDSVGTDRRKQPWANCKYE